MAKNKNKQSKKNKMDNYEVGYKKPPKDYQWQKGCASPNPKGRPKKPQTLREAMQIALNKEVTAKSEDGTPQKVSCLEVLANQVIHDAIVKDGPTRRILLSKDFMKIQAKEQEYEYDPEDLVTEDGYQFASKEDMDEYESQLRKFYKMTPEMRRMVQLLQERAIQEAIMEKIENERNEEIWKAERVLKSAGLYHQ